MSLVVEDVIECFDTTIVISGVKDLTFEKRGQVRRHSFIPHVVTAKWNAPSVGPETVKVSGPRRNLDGSVGQITHFIVFGLGGVQGFVPAPVWLLEALRAGGVCLPEQAC